MKSYILVLIAAFQIFACNSQNNSASINKEGVSMQTEKLVNAYIDLGIFSGVVIIAENGKPFYEKAFGLANRDTKTPNTLNTRFVIGSMNKTFTRIVILQLIEEGKLNFSDKLVKFIDGFQQAHADKITINQLLNHTSGFGDYHSVDYFELPYKQKSINGILPILKNMELDFEPGTQNQYSNAGYVILGGIIEKVTGMSYAQNIRERIADPLHLSSLVTSDVKSSTNRAIGYLKTFNAYTNNEVFISEPLPDGGFYSTTSDILKFYRAFFYNTELLSEAIRNEDRFFQEIAPLYTQKGTEIPLAGGFNGANTVHVEMPADNLSILVFANMDEPVAENIAIGISHIIHGKNPGEAILPTRLNIYNAYKEKGIDNVKQNFEALTDNWFANDPKDMILNSLGYDLLFDEKLNEALEIFKLNTELFPNVGNCWDSYGEGLLRNGEKEAALTAYKKALVIDPNIPSAKKMVKELEK